jgi:hypothetical protein
MGPEPKILFRDPNEAFRNAIARNFFNCHKDPDNGIDNWMYMHTEPDGTDAFKHIKTRRYSWCVNDNPIEEHL